MRSGKWSLIAVLGLASTHAQAFAEEPTRHQLLQQVKSLEARIEKLEFNRDQAVRTPSTNPAIVDATVNAVVRDAERRTRLPSELGFTAGYKDARFLIQSEDGNFLLHPWVQLQFRDVTTFREGAKSGDDDIQNGFELRRMKLAFDGNVFTPRLTYLFRWAVNRSTEVFSLDEAWARYRFEDSPFAIRAGQFKDPFSHEQIVSGRYLFAAERSLATDYFAAGNGFVQGVSGSYEDPSGHLRSEIAFTDGLKSVTNFQDFPNGGNNLDWGVAGRVEYKAMGQWNDYTHLTSIGSKEPLLVFGGALDYSEGGDTALLSQTIDVQYMTPDRVTFYAAAYGRYTRHNQGPLGFIGGSTASSPIDDTFDWGGMAQLGYMVTPRWEPYVRYDFIHLDAGVISPGAEKNVHELTVGANYYLHGHSAKFTVDLMYLPNGSPFADDGSGVLANNGQSEVILRTQFQLLL